MVVALTCLQLICWPLIFSIFLTHLSSKPDGPWASFISDALVGCGRMGRLGSGIHGGKALVYFPCQVTWYGGQCLVQAGCALSSPVGITSPTYRKLLVEVPACSEPKFRHSDLLRSVRSAFPGTPASGAKSLKGIQLEAHSLSTAVDPGDSGEGILDLRPLTLCCFHP